MAIITISRELAALGDETSHELAKSLGYRFVDKKVLEDRIKSYGISGSKFKKYDERKPSFFASLSQDRDDYLHYLKTAILAEAEHGNCVFTGRGASIVLENIPAVFSVFLAASMDIRIERVKSYFHCDEKRARQIIEHSDQDRAGFHLYFFDLDWKDPAHYSIALNTGIFSPAACSALVRELINQTVTPETEELHTLRIKEMILGQRIKHHIIYDKGIPIRFLDTVVAPDTVTLYGVAQSQALVEAAVSAAREIADTQVHSEIQLVQEYSIIA
jgi:cytidylate kinase